MVGVSPDRAFPANKDTRCQVGRRTGGVVTKHADTVEDLHRERVRLQSLRGTGGSFFGTIVEVELKELKTEIAWAQHAAQPQGGAS
jgi:hypothetical protein